MKIQIEHLRFQCIIGILDFERQKEQDVIINTTIKYDFDKEFINYADVVNLIKKTMIKKKFLLIEDALQTLEQKLKKNFPAIKKLKLKITKPSILPDCAVSVSVVKRFDS